MAFNFGPAPGEVLFTQGTNVATITSVNAWSNTVIAVATHISRDGGYTAFGHPVMTVLSGSMAPVIRTGDLIVDNPVTPAQASTLQPGQIVYTPMVNDQGKVAIEGLTLKLAEDEYLFTQSAGLKWLEFLREHIGAKVELEDVTPDYTCYALQWPRST